MNSKRSLAQIENKRLLALRDWLLPMLMNGQVAIHDKTDDSVKSV